MRSPPIKAEPRWGREDTMDRNPTNDGYRRRSPGKQELSGDVMLICTSHYLKLLIPNFTSTYPILIFLNSAPLHSHTERRSKSLPAGIWSELSPPYTLPSREVGARSNHKRNSCHSSPNTPSFYPPPLPRGFISSNNHVHGAVQVKFLHLAQSRSTFTLLHEHVEHLLSSRTCQFLLSLVNITFVLWQCLLLSLL